MLPVQSSRSPCSICGAERTVHEAVRGAVCSNLTCQTAFIKQQKALEKQVFEEKCDEVADIFASRNAASDTIRARVPYLGRPVVKTPEVDKRAFRKSLREALRETVAKAAHGKALPLDEEPERETPVLDVSCIACRGFCCRQGAGHAFLKPEYLPTVLARRPADNPAKVYRDYIRRIPEKSMEDACLYQGEQGCVLPREKRSFICNDFECADRLRLKSALAERGDASALVIAMEGDSVKASVIASPGKPLDWVEI